MRLLDVATSANILSTAAAALAADVASLWMSLPSCRARSVRVMPSGDPNVTDGDLSPAPEACEAPGYARYRKAPHQTLVLQLL